MNRSEGRKVSRGEFPIPHARNARTILNHSRRTEGPFHNPVTLSTHESSRQPAGNILSSASPVTEPRRFVISKTQSCISIFREIDGVVAYSVPRTLPATGPLPAERVTPLHPRHGVSARLRTRIAIRRNDRAEKIVFHQNVCTVAREDAAKFPCTYVRRREYRY